MKKLFRLLLELLDYHHIVFYTEILTKEGKVFYKREMWLSFLPQGEQVLALRVGPNIGRFLVQGGAHLFWNEE